MDTITVLFGTESGNSEMVADDVRNTLEDRGIKSEVFSMDDYAIDDFVADRTVVLITSTYGEGDLPNTAIAFHEALTASRPDLSGLRFAAFGLGDSSYDSYNLGIAALISACVDLGASQIGSTGFHDANTGLDPSDVAADWLQDIAPLLPP